MSEKCKSCGGTGWRSLDLKSDSVHSIMIQMGVDAEVACTECEAGRAELVKAVAASKKKRASS